MIRPKPVKAASRNAIPETAQQPGALHTLLLEEQSFLVRLQDLLREEARQLLEAEPTELLNLAADKQSLVTKLNDVADRRQHQLALTDGTRETIGNRLTALDVSGELNRIFDANLAVATKCELQNRANGARINRRHVFCQRSLRVLSGGSQEALLYSADGASLDALGQHRLGTA